MKEDNQTIQYFLYARKSTDEKDRQILSLPSQVEDMKVIAERSGLKIYQIFKESKSAQAPNKRPDFNEVIAGVKAGKAQGIICWKLDRLARNPDEAGIIMGMLQRGEIKHIKTSDKEYYPDDNSLLSYVEFGIANQFSRDLAKNVKRGIDKKANAGVRPTLVPLGYLNSKIHLKGEQQVSSDQQRFAMVRQLWDMMLTGNYSVPAIFKFANETLHLTQPATRNRPERKLQLSMMYRMFTNPFYYGWYEWGNGNWIEGQHEKMITEKEFDIAQKLLGRAGRPRPKEHKFAFTGLMRCASCGSSITAEEKIKRQKNGNVHHYIYYHCTKKKSPDCTERAIEIKDFTEQVDAILERLQISEHFQKWAIKYLHEIRKQEAQAQESSFAAKQRSLISVTKQLDNLLLKYTSPENEGQQLIADQEYQALKIRLLKQKSALEAELKAQGQHIEQWLELSERTFNFARYARIWFARGDLDTKRAIFACLSSHPLLEMQKVALELRKPFKQIFEGLPQAEQELLKLEPLETAVNTIDIRQLADKFPVWSG
jgi:site-specific DNA recombinase